MLYITTQVYTLIMCVFDSGVVWMGFARMAEQPKFNTFLVPEELATPSLRWTS